MAPIGWNVINVPNKAPTSDTKLWNTGIPLAMQYAMMVIAPVQHNQVVQCCQVFAARCLEPRRTRTMKYLAVNWGMISIVGSLTILSNSQWLQLT